MSDPQPPSNPTSDSPTPDEKSESRTLDDTPNGSPKSQPHDLAASNLGSRFDATIADTPLASAHSPPTTSPEQQPTPRRVVLPILLASATVVSTFWVGTTHWQPVTLLNWMAAEGNHQVVPLRTQILMHWDQGLIYMLCVMSILMFHEFGHFLMTLWYRVPASFPIFLPFPFNPIGTFGAVIGMHGMKADRKQIFDIGLAGPLAGLVVAVPVMIWGVMQLDVSGRAAGDLQMNCPLGVVWMIQWLRPDLAVEDGYIWLSHANPYFVAGWVGFLVTGLNMMPISQLDGGHVAYTLLGRKAHWVARLIIAAAIGFMVYHMAPTLILMTVLLLLVGTDHPPTRNDSVPLGLPRIILGWISLIIPLLCFPPFIFRIV